MLIVINTDPACSSVIRTEDAADSAHLRAGKDGRISLSWGGHAKSDHVSLVHIRQLGEVCSVVGGVPQTINAAACTPTREPEIAFMSWNSFEPDGIPNSGKPCSSAGGKGHAPVNAGVKLSVGKGVKLFRIYAVRRNTASSGQTVGSCPGVAIVSRKENSQSVGVPDNAACVSCCGNRSSAICAQPCRIIVSLKPVAATVKTKS